MAKYEVPPISLLYDNPAAIRHAIRAMSRADELFGGDLSLDEAEALCRERLESAVIELERALENTDPFDAIEMVRRTVMPINLDGYKETEDDGLAMAVELTAMFVESARREPNTEFNPTRVCDAAKEIVEEIGFLRQIRLLRNPHPLGFVAFQLGQQDLSVRSIQYEHVRDQQLRLLFSSPEVEKHCVRLLGFTMSQVLSVYQALVGAFETRMNDSFDDLSRRGLTPDVVFGLDAENPTGGMSEADRALFEAVFVAPGKLSMVSGEDISRASGLSAEVTHAVLDFVSFEIGSVERRDVVQQVLDGKSPVVGRSFAKLGDSYALVHPALLFDRIRGRMELVLAPDLAAWRAYERHRARTAETTAVSLMNKLLGLEDPLVNLRYLAPPTGSLLLIPDSLSGAERRSAVSRGELIWAECDALYVCENVAVVVEVKAGGLTPRARTGFPDRLARDLTKTIGNAAVQAKRLERLILECAGVWTESGDWLDLSRVTVVHSVAVSLDEFSGAAVGIDELVRADLVPPGSIPWAVSLHDLAIIAEVLEYTAAFVLYLRRRTSPSISKLFRTSDELDLFMLFLRGDLYALADPAILASQGPRPKAPSKKDLRAFEQQPLVMVQSYTDDLDAWMFYEHGLSSVEAPKPKLVFDSRMQALAQWLERDHKPGWFGFAPDLLEGDRETQRSFAIGVESVIERSRQDGSSHSFAQSLNGQWGYVVLAVMSRGNGETIPARFERLRVYSTLKKYQLRASRSLALLLGPGLEFEAVDYLDEPWKRDPLAEQLVTDAKFRSVTPVPPSAKRRSRRLRK